MHIKMDEEADAVVINVFGDFAPSPSLVRALRENKNKSLFRGDFRQTLDNSSLNIFNLELPLTLSMAAAGKSGPSLKGDPSLGEIIARSHMHVATLANNHMMDFGETGLEDTLNILVANRIGTVGAGLSRMKNAHRYRTAIKGCQISVLNVAEQEFGVVDYGDGDRVGGVVREDCASIYYWIAEERKSADVVVLIIHGGSEHHPLPSPSRQRRARLYADFGADAVIYHHTHVASASEIYNGVPIFYGLGNFVFDRRGSDDSWNIGLRAKLTLSGGRVSESEVLSFKYEDGEDGEDGGVRLLASNEAIALNTRLQALNDCLADEDALSAAWDKFCAARRDAYLRLSGVISPLQNWLIRKGAVRAPMYRDKDLLAVLNLLRCDAYRDVACNVLVAEARKRLASFVG